METKRHHTSIISITIILIAILFTFNEGRAYDEFPIATTTGREMAYRAAFDGTNYLVGMIQGDTTATQSVTAQLVSQTGALVGSLISLGVSGWDIGVAFDGTNYLIVWVVDNPAGGFYDSIISGQFVSPSGTLVGSPFVINQDIGTNELSGIAFAGNNYLIIWEGDESGKEVVRGQLVSKSGTLVGSKILITGSSSIDQNQAAVASNGTNFLAVWSDGSRSDPGLAEDIYGQFVSPSGNLSGSNFLINQNNYPSDNPLSLTCDTATGNCLVVWTDEVGGYGSGEWDVFGQRVDTSGNLVGGVINVSTASGQQFLPLIAFDGTNYLVSWTDMRNDANKNWTCDAGEGTCLDIYGQYVSKTGALVGTEFVINNDAGNQMGGVAGFNGGKYLVLINTGIRLDPPGCTEDCDIASDDVYGVFVTDVFSDVPSGYWAEKYIIAIYNDGITQGCAQDDPNTPANERRYCPEESVTRGQMAAFITRAKYGETFSYTTTPYFTDVPSTHTFFKYVQKLKDDGITVVSGTYGVDTYVTRGQMAAFIVRSKFGENFTYTQTPYFGDVPSTHTFFKYVQKLKDERITTVTGTYGIDSIVTRAQMAAFLSRAFLGME